MVPMSINQCAASFSRALLNVHPCSGGNMAPTCADVVARAGLQ